MTIYGMSETTFLLLVKRGRGSGDGSSKEKRYEDSAPSLTKTCQQLLYCTRRPNHNPTIAHTSTHTHLLTHKCREFKHSSKAQDYITKCLTCSWGCQAFRWDDCTASRHERCCGCLLQHQSIPGCIRRMDRRSLRRSFAGRGSRVLPHTEMGSLAAR